MGTIPVAEYCAVPCAHVPNALCGPDGAVLTDAASADAPADADDDADAEGRDATPDAADGGPGDADAGSGPPAPRQIAPLSTSTVASQRPTFRWSLATATDGAVLELCRDRAMRAGCLHVNATGPSGQTAAPLAQGVWFWRVRGRAGSLEGTQASPVWQLNVGARSAPADTSWGTMLDVNGDGFADVAIAASHGISAGGQVFVYMGSSAGLSGSPAVALSDPSGMGEPFGFDVASAGDVNGDGYSDLLVAQLTPSGSSAGNAYVYLGSSAGLTDSPSIVLQGRGTADTLAIPCAGLGDVDGDGYGDVAVNAVGTSGGAITSGHIDVFRGGPMGPAPTASSSIDSGESGTAALAVTIAAAGDLDGNGRADLVLGDPAARSGAGAVLVFGGSDGGLEATRQVEIPAPSGRSAFGAVVASAGDFNGDGLADIAVSADDPSHAGAVFIFDGTTPLPALHTAPDVTAEAPGGADSDFGTAIRAGGDLDGDGFGDMLIGAPGVAPAGTVYVYQGNDRGRFDRPLAPANAPDSTIGLTFGHAIAAGDFDGDGHCDAVITAPEASMSAGRAYAFRGSFSGLGDPSSLTPGVGTGPNSEFGVAVASAWMPRARGVRHSVSVLFACRGTRSVRTIVTRGGRMPIRSGVP